MSEPSKISVEWGLPIKLGSDHPDDVFHMLENDFAVCESPTFYPRLVDCISGEIRPLTYAENIAWEFSRFLPRATITRQVER